MEASVYCGACPYYNFFVHISKWLPASVTAMTHITSLQMPVFHCPASVTPSVDGLLQSQPFAHKLALYGLIDGRTLASSRTATGTTLNHRLLEAGDSAQRFGILPGFLECGDVAHQRRSIGEILDTVARG